MKTQNFRDGASQKTRLLRALEPDYVAVDEQSWSDLLLFAQKYSQHLTYYDESNQKNGDWSSFFEGDIQQMVAYINDPESFNSDRTTLSRFSQPHLVLFFTFLQLLHYPQQQFKELTPRHTKYYYKEVLKLTEQKSIPDRVHLVFELESEEQSYLLKQGTLLSAGQDSQGIERNYAVDEDIVLNQAQIASVKTLSVKKALTDIRSLHNFNDKSELDFEAILCWALGDLDREDKLPDFNGTEVNIDYLNNLYQEIKNQRFEEIAQDSKDYILQQLFFTAIEDFKYCLNIHYREINQNGTTIQQPTELEWNQVYQLIEKVHHKKINSQRRDTLKQELESYGFEEMMNFALGSPNPGDLLPKMPEGFDTLEELLNNLDLADSAVVEYIQEQLCLSLDDFRKIMKIKNELNPINSNELCRLVEKAQTKKRNYSYPSLSKNEIINLNAVSLTDIPEGSAIDFKRFKTFTTNLQDREMAIGLAIASPILLLSEGRRVISLNLVCEDGTLDHDAITDIVERAILPFEIYLSTEEQWLKVNSNDLEFGAGYFLLEQPLRAYTSGEIHLEEASPGSGNFVRLTLILTSSQGFSAEDIGSFLVLTDNKVYKITSLLSDRDVTIQGIENSTIDTSSTEICLYSSSAISFNSLQFKITLDSKQPAIVPLSAEESTIAIDTSYPTVKILLKDVPEAENSERKITYYEKFRSIRIEKTFIKVDVQHIQSFNLRNDNSIINPKSPFEPFGYSPKVGSGFYFANAEISRKKLDSLALHIDWMELPENFATHYQAYSSTGIISKAIANDSFKAQLKLLNNRSWVDVEAAKSLFTEAGTTLSNPIQLEYQDFNLPGYLFDFDTEEIDADDPFEYLRYFKLELESPNFGHDFYPLVLTKVVLATDSNRNLTVYPPYTPTIKALSLDYSASVEINLTTSKEQHSVNQIFQLHPFGYINLQNPDNREFGDRSYYFLPQYEREGELYLGIRDLQPSQNLSLLFQMVAGSANTELAKPDIHWSYLSSDRWQDFPNSQILSDTTNGLVDAGIIRFKLPKTATKENHLLPSGFHWLRAAVAENATAIPDTLDIKAQAVSATFINQGNAEDHLSKNLAADSIQGLLTRNSAIERVFQPYSSFGGKSQEDSRAFNTRVSERLRHKQRAITPWDYERLVLERFPEIYKVKCITSAVGSKNASAAEVTIVVIPDITNTAPFFPLEPKAPLYLLKEIEAYLNSHTSPFVNLIVKNPRYEQIKYRLAIRLRSGYEEGHYLEQLNQELVRFLSPWAYEGEADITIGSSIHNSSIVHLIEKEPYVDYVAQLKLIEQISVEPNTFGKPDADFQLNQSYLAQARYPDSILVSAPEHIIDLISTEQYEEEEFEGIDYMIVDVDLIVT